MSTKLIRRLTIFGVAAVVSGALVTIVSAQGKPGRHVRAASSSSVMNGMVVGAHIEANLWTPWVSVLSFAPGESVTLSYDATNDGIFEYTQTQTTDSGGNSNFNIGSTPVREGAHIVATSASYERSMIVSLIRVEYANASTNVVAGVAPASTDVHVQITQAGPPIAELIVTSDGSGTWSSDFTGTFDFASGQSVAAFVRDGEGNMSRSSWEAVVPRIDASYSQYGANSLTVSDFAPGTSVRVRVDYGNNGGPLSGFDYDVTQVVDTRFGTLFDIGGFDLLHPGDHIVATGGGWTKDLVTAPLRVEKADPTSDVVGGTASPSTMVTATIESLEGGGPPEQSLTVTSDAAGWWSADFSALVDFVAGRHVRASVYDADGDETRTGWFAVVPHISVGATDGPPSQVGLTMFASGTSVRVRVDYGNNGSFDFDQTVTVTDMFGTGVNLGGSGLVHAGDYVLVEGGGWIKSLVAAQVAVTSVNASNDTVAGTAAAGAQVTVSLSTPPGSPGGPPVATLVVTAGTNGLWTADFSALADIVPLQQANADIADIDGDVTEAIGWASESTWPKTGFESPILNPPAVNTRTAGSVVPVRFSLGGYRGMDIIESGFPASATITCGTNPTLTSGSQIASPGRTLLSYNVLTGLYELRWATVKLWKGTCRQLVVKFTDGTYLRANFSFGK